ncbi:hypothetical protein VPNG_02131 [Cytospora leucostoma]|uniref:Uncharacterized protein n=1 Tax=Cytospora leucostoma TaxID=1230097 RepID=A0A423XHC4_9PEZI|nr:hypothetical protein VPNG_02131 [Cytospora leucostoma]
MLARILAVISLLALTQADTPKANEYTSTDCSGTINYPHHSSSLIDVTMDDSSQSVYLAGGEWSGFSDKTSDGGSCYGDSIRLYGACNPLAQSVGGSDRIKCVRKS